MPGLDGRGPNGNGSMTGRGLGRCKGNYADNNNQANSDIPIQNNNNLFGRGFGRGMGRGMSNRGGRGRGFGRGNRGGWG